MTLQELKEKIRDLGFDDDATLAEYADIINNAIVRACKTIALTVKAPVGRLDINFKVLGRTTTAIEDGSTTNPIDINGQPFLADRFNVVTVLEDVKDAFGNTIAHKDQDYYFDGNAWRKTGRYDLDFLTTDESGNIMFESVDRIVVDSDTSISTFGSWDMVQDHILVISSSLTTPLTIYYNERILPITETTQDDAKVQVVYQCEPLVGLLAAHYVWLDDDERKAILYWNEYDQLKQEIMAKALKPKAKVVGGIRWHN